MAGYKNIDPKGGVKFGQGQKQGKGRKKKIYTILKETGYSADDVRTAFQEMAFYSLEELRKAKNDESLPVITRITANQFHNALQKNDYTKIKEILEHFIGKAPQKIENEMSGNMDINISPIKFIKTK